MIKHIHSGMYGTFKNTEVEMLGFYSNKHHAIFTHHTTNMHVHIKSDKVTGHADSFTLGENMILKLPK
jgi:acetolactate decarboxylase